MTDLPYLIAGGGIAGLATALGLAGTGRSVRLFEQAAAFEEVGAGLQMSPNGVRALQALGAWEAVEPACVIPTEIHVRDGRSGAILQRIRLGKPFEDRFGAPYRVCHRADLLNGLLATARNSGQIELTSGQRAASARTTASGAMLTLDNASTVEGRAVIAADGIRSALRSAIAGPVEPVFRGHAIYRGLIAFDKVPADIEADCVTLWLYPGGHVVHYAVSNWRSFNIVAAINASDSEGGWSTPSNNGPLREVFADADETLAGLIDAPLTWLKWRGADLPPVATWCTGNMALVGDAAHATLPYLAQGAVMSIEDASVLARHVAATETPAEAFIAYAAERQPRTARIQAESRKLGGLYHAGGLLAVARNAALRLMGPEAALKRNQWIYEWKP